MIRIGVSACLLGENVRYDGGNKFSNINQYFNSDIYDLKAICPEVEIGMSIPRPPIQIINNGSIKLVQVENHNKEFTQQMNDWFIENLNKLSQLSGFILKSKSPSCGYQTTRHYETNGNYFLDNGYFVNLIKSHNKSLPIIDELSLHNKTLLNQFIDSLE